MDEYDDRDEMRKVEIVKAKYESELLKKKNVVGVGIGYREVDGQVTEQIVLTVMVKKKHPLFRLVNWDVIPSELDGVPVDVKEIGQPRAGWGGG